MNLKSPSLARLRPMLMLGFLLLGACSKQAPDDATQAPAEPPALSSPADASNQNVAIQVGMPYEQAREQLLTSGWMAPPMPDGGYDAMSAKVKAECQGDVDLCNAMPEIESCSGSGEGECVMSWSNADGQQLRIVTSGGLDQAQVQSIETLPTSAATKATTACPSPNFNEFLTAFRSSTDVQKAFTTTPLSVSFLDSTQADAAPQSKTEKLAWEDIPKPLIASAEGLVTEGLTETISESAGSYRVQESQEGTGVKKVYIFSNSDGCWHLTAIDDQSI